MATTKPWSFFNQITQQLMTKLLPEEKAPTLWPSEARAEVNGQVYGACLRASYYRYLSDAMRFTEVIPEVQHPLSQQIQSDKLPDSQYLLWIGKQGELFEEYCRQLGKESGVHVASQHAIFDKAHHISGKLDLVVFNPMSNRYSIVELKSVYGFGGNETLGTDAQRRRGEMGKPKDSHLMQLGFYHWHYMYTHNVTYT